MSNNKRAIVGEEEGGEKRLKVTNQCSSKICGVGRRFSTSLFLFLQPENITENANCASQPLDQLCDKSDAQLARFIEWCVDGDHPIIFSAKVI